MDGSPQLVGNGADENDDNDETNLDVEPASCVLELTTHLRIGGVRGVGGRRAGGALEARARARRAAP